jgi:hypothetical protein
VRQRPLARLAESGLPQFAAHRHPLCDPGAAGVALRSRPGRRSALGISRTCTPGITGAINETARGESEHSYIGFDVAELMRFGGSIWAGALMICGRTDTDGVLA